MDAQNRSINYGIHSTLEPRQVKQECDVPHLCQCSTPAMFVRCDVPHLPRPDLCVYVCKI